MPWKKYQQDGPHSYAFGIFPTLELLRYQLRWVHEVLLHSRAEGSDGVAKIRALCAHTRIPVTVNDRLVERLSPKENTYAVGVFQKYYPKLNPAANHLVLVNPADMGNLGTISRTLLGFGISDLALIRPAADIFDPRVVRASMGALFGLAFSYFESFAAYRQAFPAQAVYPFMTDGVFNLPDARFEPPFALVFGSESSGLPADFLTCGRSIRIPQRATVDSFNLAVAVGIALYAAAGQAERR